jgi:hypothetical protein
VTPDEPSQTLLRGAVIRGHHSHIGAPLTPLHFFKHMTSQVATLLEKIDVLTEGFSYAVNSLTLLKDEVKELQEENDNLNKKIVKQSVGIEVQSFHDFLIEIFAEVTGDNDFAKRAVLLLNECRTQPTMTYHSLNILYREIDENDVMKRNAMASLSKVYRFVFGNSYRQADLRSEVKYLIKCPHCGSMAKAIIEKVNASTYLTVTI